MKTSLSIIVPIYNVEPYLRACLDSILRQKFTEYELILIDDGSPDHSGRICDEYASVDKRIIVIHKKNGGVSSARNAGLNVAHGDYITFVDPDDELEETYQKNMDILLSNSKIDMLQFPVYSEKKATLAYQFEKELILNGFDEIITAWAENGTLSWIVWNKIYKKDVWKCNRFPEGMIAEDVYVCVDIMSKTNCVYLSNKGKYTYKYRKNSISNKKISLKIRPDWIVAELHNLNRLNSIGASKKIRSIIFISILRKIIRLQLHNYDLDLTSEFAELKKQIPSISLYKHINSSSFESKFSICKFFAGYILLRFCSIKQFVFILLLLKNHIIKK